MEITRIRLTDLEQNKGQVEGLPSNPREWTRTDLDKLVKSIRETPELLEARGLIVWPYNGKYVIMGGNMRFSALREMNAKDAPCYVLPEDTSLEKLKEIVIKDNGAFGAWDMDMLANEWDDLALTDWGVPAWETVSLEEIDTKEVKEDDFGENNEHIEVRCKRGDIWQLGEHRLMCGDSINLDDVKKLMGGVKADIAFASPPYNTGGIGKNLTKDNGRTKYNDNADDLSDNEYTDFLQRYIDNACECSQYNFVNIQWLANNKHSLIDIMNANRDKLGDIIIWDKARSQPQLAANVLNSEFEFVFCFHEKGNRRIGTIPFHGTQKNIIHITPGHNEFSEIHNAVFPVALTAHFIENFAKETVLDLFGGTGTTMIAAEQLGRKAYLMELDPKYCDVIIARWEKYTGNTATKLNE